MAADVAADQPRVKIDAAARRAGHIDRYRPVDGVLRLAGLRRTQHERSSGRNPPMQRRGTVTLTQSRRAASLRLRGESKPAGCVATTRHARQTASAAT